VTGTQPDIIHVHEWQTGALPILYWDMYHHLSLKVLPSLIATVPASSFLTDNPSLYAIEFFLQLDKKSVGSIVSSLFCSVDLCVCFLANSTKA